LFGAASSNNDHEREETVADETDNFDVIDDGYDDYRPKRGGVSGQYLACSMPVQVPARFRAFGMALDRTSEQRQSSKDSVCVCLFIQPTNQTLPQHYCSTTTIIHQLSID
jgi:hypothetical protein